MIYSALNDLKLGNNFLYGLFWVPNSEVKNIYSQIDDIKEDRNILVPQIKERKAHGLLPPTYFKLNGFTALFQEIVNTYGVPSYKEVNPAIFWIITFPFLFGIMFGDIGHGFVLFLIGVFLWILSEEARDSQFRSLHSIRYLILLMGFFSTFSGILYNDFMSIPLDYYSCYHKVREGNRIIGRAAKGCVLPTSVDVFWYLSENELTFLNSLKMKLAVIIGVSHMTLGILMKGLNSIYFSKPVDFLFEFIPQLILLLSLFGFMNLLIILKWIYPWGDREDPNTDPPSIITIMINMFLKQGAVDPKTEPLILDASTQKLIWNILVITAIVWIPLMLFIKPFYLRDKIKSHNNHRNLSDRISYESEENKTFNEHIQKESVIDKEKDYRYEQSFIIYIEEEVEIQSFSDIFVHQLIETIEFSLGTISNTASYLRLWALSLAHSQLASVFYDKLMNDIAISNSSEYSYVFIFIMFPVYITFTLFVLLWMDSLECFLHTLRLHWVEFQNKFYKGNGYLFQPLSFEKELEGLKNNNP